MLQALHVLNTSNKVLFHIMSISLCGLYIMAFLSLEVKGPFLQQQQQQQWRGLLSPLLVSCIRSLARRAAGIANLGELCTDALITRYGLQRVAIAPRKRTNYCKYWSASTYLRFVFLPAQILWQSVPFKPDKDGMKSHHGRVQVQRVALWLGRACLKGGKSAQLSQQCINEASN